MVDVPSLNFDPEACVDRPFRLTGSGHERNTNCTEYSEVVRSSYNSFIEILKNNFPDVFVYDSRSVFCTNTKCKAVINGLIQYNDNNHLSIWGSMSVVDSLIATQPYTFTSNLNVQ